MIRLDLRNTIITEDMEHIYASRDSWEALKNSSIYITGASGMIASYFVLFLIYLNEEKGYEIAINAGVRNKEKIIKRFGEYAEREYFTILEGDVINIAYSDEFKPDYVVHAASFASPQYYGVYPVETMLPNLMGTIRLLELMRKYQGKGMLFFSSGSVYGSIIEQESITEDMVGTMKFLELGNCYGESKRCGEALCSAYYHEYGIPTKIARIHHTYGPSMDYMHDKRVFAEFVKNIVNSENIVMKSDGSAKRAFCYISDMVAGLYKVLLDGENAKPYNLANEQQYISIGDLARQLVAIYPEKNLSVVVQKERTDEYHPSNEKRIIPVNCTSIEQLGWIPVIDTIDGFRRTINYIHESCYE